MLTSFAKIYDQIFDEGRILTVQRVVVVFAFICFVINLFGIFLNTVIDTPPVVASLGTNYLAAIFTPFAIILFFEVYLLILAIPSNMTTSILFQYEIISLIILWNIFKDASGIQDLRALSSQGELLQTIGLDIIAAVILFGLVALFQYTKNLCPDREKEFIPERDYDTFLNIKKLITLGLTVVIFVLGVVFVGQWLSQLVTEQQANLFDLQNEFFANLFTVMIFTDIFIVLLSYLFMESFEVIYRNAIFIISTILIRLSLTAGENEKLYQLGFAIAAVSLGVITNLLFKQYDKVHTETKQVADKDIIPPVATTTTA